MLLTFKEQVIDSPGMLSTWSKKQDCCKWAGVECDHFTHRVTKLSLPCDLLLDTTECLAGEFSLSNLLELEFLNYLDLSRNYLSFSPPHCCANYSSKLLHLDLSFNHPELVLEDLSWLTQLYSLESLSLSAIVLPSTLWLQSMSLLPSLSELHLSSCQLNHINRSLEFVNFTSLQVLDLSNNHFQSSKLPKWLFYLSHDILYLDLSKNSFQGSLPKTILNLQKLKSLNLSCNYLDGPIPNWLGQYENLQYLVLYGNNFVGCIPETIGNLSFLIELSLGYNPLSGNLPNSLRQLSNLEILDVEGTFLTGALSEKNVSQLSNLKELQLGSPVLTYQFDPHWIPSFQLQRLDLFYVHLQLPSWLYTQKSLKCLSINNSSLSFEDEDKFLNFVAEVEFLYLAFSSINVDLSKVILNAKAIFLGGNNLTGGLPRISPNVIVYRAIYNSFLGTLSSLLCQKMERKSNLSFLEITGSNLSGGLTDCWMNWKSLVHIVLPSNNLTGKIPESMSLLSNLKSLHLDNNNLFGYVPASLQNCQKLSFLNLGENQFSGNIPYWISQSVKVLLLRSNQFSGNITPQLCHLSSLVGLDIADNRLSGTIPNCLHNITAMVSHNTSNTNSRFPINFLFGTQITFQYSFVLHIKGNQLAYSSIQKVIHHIDLSHNNLTGTIPAELLTLTKLQSLNISNNKLTGTITLTKLQSLNISNNKLTGTIPKEIVNLKQLESLDLSNNQISGKIPQSMSELSFLGTLNLSFNNFIGQIPPTAQFQRFDVLCYIGNPGLCGAPLSKNCTQEEKANLTKPIEENQEEEEFLSWFYFGIGVGFATGFWAACASLFFNRAWRPC